MTRQTLKSYKVLETVSSHLKVGIHMGIVLVTSPLTSLQKGAGYRNLSHEQFT